MGISDRFLFGIPILKEKHISISLQERITNMSTQCAAMTPNGKQCNRKIKNGKFCVMHDPKYKKARSANARRAGKFANKKRWKKKDKITNEPFQELITAMVRKALVDILTR